MAGGGGGSTELNFCWLPESRSLPLPLPLPLCPPCSLTSRYLMKVDLPVEYWPSSSTLGLASKSPSLSSGLRQREEGRQGKRSGAR